MLISLRQHGASADGRTLDTGSIQSAIDLLSASGGGKLVFDAGCTFLSGSIVLRAGVELHL